LHSFDRHRLDRLAAFEPLDRRNANSTGIGYLLRAPSKKSAGGSALIRRYHTDTISIKKCLITTLSLDTYGIS